VREFAADARDLVDGLDHVHRDADGARLVGDGARDGLADPPRGVGGELEAAGVVELHDRAHEPEVALLDEVEHRHPAAVVAARDRDDQAKVRRGQPVAGSFVAGLDALGERDLLARVQQGHAADLAQVHADRVAGGLGHVSDVGAPARLAAAGGLRWVEVLGHLSSLASLKVEVCSYPD
jgi:hypothetical protein